MILEITSPNSKRLKHRLFLIDRLVITVLSLLVVIMSMGVSAPPVYADNADYAPNEILVGFTSGATPAAIAAFDKYHGLVLLKEFLPLRLRHYQLPEGLLVEEARQLLADDPIVNYVEPNYINKPLVLPSDPGFGEQWSLHNTGQVVNGTSGSSDVDMDWPEAMDIYTGTTDVVVAVIDSGVGLDHSDFGAPNTW